MADTDSKKRFTYTARDRFGTVITGIVSAIDSTEASGQIRAKSLSPITIVEGKSGLKKDLNFSFKRHKKMKSRDLAIFARQFAAMANAGIPLVLTLDMLTEQSEHPELKRVLPLVKRDIEAGRPLSAGLAKHPMVFPPLMVNMIASGESGSGLAKALKQTALNYEKDALLKAKVKSASTYPVVVLVLAFVMVAFLMIFVVPTFEKIFKGYGHELPAPTLVLIWISHAAVYGIPAVIVAAIIFGRWWSKHKDDLKVLSFIDPLKLKIPVLGRFVRLIVLARFARILSALLESGVPLSLALAIVGKTAGSIVVTNALRQVSTEIKAGKPLSPALKQHQIFGVLLPGFVGIGEESGTVSSSLESVATFYEDDVERMSEQLAALLEPILIVFLGVIVGGILVALYLPMFTVNTLI